MEMTLALPLLLAIGAGVGCLGAMLGIGGGIIIVPLLTLALGYTPQMAVGTSMVVVLLNTLSSAAGYLRRGLVCRGAALRFGLATLPGAAAGGYVSHLLQGQSLYAVFGLFFLLIGGKMFLRGDRKRGGGEADASIPSYNKAIGTLLSTVIGFLASLLGIGGGVFHVPMMTGLLRFPVKTAIATSSAILALSSLSGAVSHAVLGHVAWPAALCLGGGAVLGAQVGVRAAARARTDLLIRGAGLLILAVGIRFLSALF